MKVTPGISFAIPIDYLQMPKSCFPSDMQYMMMLDEPLPFFFNTHHPPHKLRAKQCSMFNKQWVISNKSATFRVPNGERAKKCQKSNIFQTIFSKTEHQFLATTMKILKF